jgi:hypothetical protein
MKHFLILALLLTGCATTEPEEDDCPKYTPAQDPQIMCKELVDHARINLSNILDECRADLAKAQAQIPKKKTKK